MDNGSKNIFLDEFFDYKNKLMELLCSDLELMKLVTGNDDLTQNDMPLRSAIYRLIFPYEFTPETTEHAESYICFDVDIDKVYNKTFLNPTLAVFAICHKSNLRTPHSGVRTDAMASRIDAILNGNREFTLGTLELKSVERFVPITDFQGRVLIYTGDDWNRPGVSKKVPPTR